MSDLAALTDWISSSPLAWLALTIGIWCAADAVAAAFGRHPLANPLLMSIVAIVVLLKATNTSYAVYSSGVQFMEFLIGPAIVSIAVPLFKNWATVKRNAAPIVTALVVGSLTAIASAAVMGDCLDCRRPSRFRCCRNRRPPASRWRSARISAASRQ
jgi:putative effector of murein hydrolase